MAWDGTALLRLPPRLACQSWKEARGNISRWRLRLRGGHFNYGRRFARILGSWRQCRTIRLGSKTFWTSGLSPSAIFKRLVALGLLAGALVLAARSGALGSAVRTPVTAGAARVMAVGFALRALGDFHFLGFFKSVHGTPFAYFDTWFYNPLFICLAVICATASLD
jgi:Protein of unknown function (DUF3995)